MKIHKLCPKCGIFNQMELQYDSGWQVECMCGKIIPIDESEVPKGLDRRQYEVVNLPSPKDVITALPLPYGYYRPSIRRDYDSEE